MIKGDNLQLPPTSQESKSQVGNIKESEAETDTKNVVKKKGDGRLVPSNSTTFISSDSTLYLYCSSSPIFHSKFTQNKMAVIDSKIYLT